MRPWIVLLFTLCAGPTLARSAEAEAQRLFAGHPPTRRVWTLCATETAVCDAVLRKAYADLQVHPSVKSGRATYQCKGVRQHPLEVRDVYRRFMSMMDRDPSIGRLPIRSGMYQMADYAGLCDVPRL